MAYLNKTITVEHLNARNIFKPNWLGEATPKNAKGNRNFNIRLRKDPDCKITYDHVEYYLGSDEVDEVGHSVIDNLIIALENDGWKISYLKEDASKGWTPDPLMKVALSLHPPRSINPPKICYYNDAGKGVEIPEDMTDTWVDKIADKRIEYINLVITPSNWDHSTGGNHQSAYVGIIYFKFEEVRDPWADNRYDEESDLPFM